MKKILLNILLLIILHYYVNSQNRQYKFEHLSIQHGLSYSVIYGIVQDSKGFMWFTSQDAGLNKFDGYKFTIYKHISSDTNSISINSINKIKIDKFGNLWIGTWGGGLDMFDPRLNTFTHYKKNPSNKNSLSNNKIQSLYVDDQTNTIWIGTTSGLNKFEPKLKKFTLYKHDSNNTNSLSGNRIWAIEKDKLNNLWIATNNGLNKFNLDSKTFTRYEYNRNNKRGISHSQVRSILSTKNGELWIGTAAGISIYNEDTDDFDFILPYPENDKNSQTNNINTIYEDRSGTIWVGTQMGGLSKYDKINKTFYSFVNEPNNPESISYNDVRAIYQDKSGLLWIATRGGGLNKLNLNPPKFNLLKTINSSNSLSGNRIRAIAEDNDKTIWIGTDRNGLNKYDIKTKVFTHFKNNKNLNSISSNRIRALFVDSTDNLLVIGTDNGGLNILDLKTNKISIFKHNKKDKFSISDNEITSICKDKYNRIWVGTKNGLNLYSKKLKKFKRYKNESGSLTSLSDNRIRYLFTDSKGRLWIGTDNGLNRLNFSLGIFKKYWNNPNNLNTINSNIVNVIYEDNKKNIWIGTNNGLNKYIEKSKNFIRFESYGNNRSIAIYGILDDNKGNLWLSSYAGILKFNTIINEYDIYDAYDGLQSKEFYRASFCKASDNTFYFGGINGLNFFNPDSVKIDTYEPEVVFTEFKIFNENVKINTNTPLQKHINYTSEITLSYKDYMFSIDFSALHFVSSEKNKYAYMLVGFDKDWVQHNTKHFVMYNNLAPGKYIFKVKGTNSDGVWSTKISELKIIIKPPFWKKIWFHILAFSLIILLIYLFIKVRETKLKKSKIKLERIVSIRTKEIQEQKNQIQEQRDIANLQKKKITDSIRYAKRIQNAMFPPYNFLKNYFTNSFVFFQPKEIVSGDFYWISEKNDILIIAVADCTGHGVPGAFMSVLGITILNEVTNELDINNSQASDILNKLREKILQALHHDKNQRKTQEGIDIAVIKIDKNIKQLQYSGANNPIHIVRQILPRTKKIDNSIICNDYGTYELFELKPDKMPIGWYYRKNDSFKNIEFELFNNDSIYMFSDGYVDQFGGDLNRKFLMKNFKQLLVDIQGYDMQKQKELVDSNFNNWKRDNSQTDDILVIGFKINIFDLFNVT